MITEGEISVGRLLVVFERDMMPRGYSRLGEVCMNGHIQQILSGYHCKEPVKFCPDHVQPQARIRMDAMLSVPGNSEEKLEMLRHAPIPRCWFPATEGFQMAASLLHALRGGRAEAAGVLVIAKGLLSEVEDLLKAMETAADRDIRFYVTVDEDPDPPEDLVQWQRQQFMEVVEQCREILEEAGIEITEDDDPMDTLCDQF